MRLFYSCILVISCLLSRSQHPYFASLNQNLLELNPGFAGSKNELRMQAIGAIQNTNTNFKNNAFFYGADILWPKLRSGFGLSYQSLDYTGVLKKSQIDFSYSFHITVKKKFKIVPAIQVSLFDVSIDHKNLTFGDMIDSRRGFIWNTNELKPNDDRKGICISPGLLVFSKGFFAGVTILDVNQPNEGLYSNSKRRLTQLYQLGYRILLNRGSQIDFYALVKIQQPKNNFIQYGGYIKTIFPVNVHFGQRIKDSFISGLNFDNNGFKTGYNFEYHYKKYNPSKYSHEIYLSFVLGQKRKDRRDMSISKEKEKPLKLEM